MTTRVYVPSTLPRLARLLAIGGLGPAPVTAHAVTDAVRAEVGGEEDQEYAVAQAAALASLALLDDGPARRVVLAVDVDAVHVSGGEDATEVEVREEVPLRRVAAVLADSADGERLVVRARAALGTPEEDRALDRLADQELGWWAVQEADVLLAGAGPQG